MFSWPQSDKFKMTVIKVCFFSIYLMVTIKHFKDLLEKEFVRFPVKLSFSFVLTDIKLLNWKL